MFELTLSCNIVNVSKINLGQRFLYKTTTVSFIRQVPKLPEMLTLMICEGIGRRSAISALLHYILIDDIDDSTHD